MTKAVPLLGRQSVGRHHVGEGRKSKQWQKDCVASIKEEPKKDKKTMVEEKGKE